MKASDARSKSEDVLRTKTLLESTEVRSAIQKAVEKGEFKCSIYETLGKSVIDHLKSEGYQVSVDFHRNEEITTISW